MLGMLADGSISQDSTVAVIYRTNVQSRRLEEACVKNNLPYVIRGAAGGFYKRAEIKDSLCFLRWLYNGRDQASMLRAMKTPSKGIGDVAIKEFKSYCLEIENYYKENHPGMRIPTTLDVLISMSDIERDAASTLVDGAPEASVFLPKRALNRFIPFSIQMSQIQEAAYKKPLNELLLYMNDLLNLESHFDAISKTKAEFEERKENVQELRQATEKYSKKGPALRITTESSSPDDFGDNITPLSEFLDDVALVTDIKGANDSDDNRLVVSLTTIHAAKGMEYDTVFVVGVEEGTLPSAMAKEDVEIEEEKRLCYVAMTRAKSRLIMSWRKEKSIFSGKGMKVVTMNRSRFLDTLSGKPSVSQGKRTSGNLGSKTPGKPRANGSRRSFSSNVSVSAGSQRPRPQPRPSARPSSEQNRMSPPNARKAYSTSPSTATSASRMRMDASKRVSSPSSSAPPSRMRMDAARRGPPASAGIRAPSRNGRGQSPSSPNASRMNPKDSRSPPQRQWSPAPNNSRALDRPSRNISRAPQSNGVSSRSGSGPRRTPSKSQGNDSEPKDSTWIFPVGSTVIHENLGPGKVLQPPPFDGKQSEMMVRVQFENGVTKELPAAAKEIMPDFGI